MIKIKTLLLTLLTIAFLMVSSASVATDNKINETEFIKNNFSLHLMASRYDKDESLTQYLGFSYKPNDNNGLLIEYGLEHINDFDYTYDGVNYKQHLINARVGVGHQYDLNENFNITPMLGLSINNDIKSKFTETQGYTSLAFSYDLSNEFSLVVKSNYNFGSTIFTDTASVGIGFKYTPQKKTHTLSSSIIKNKNTAPIIIRVKQSEITVPIAPLQDEPLPESVTIDTTDKVFFEENNNYQQLPYTIQLGAYQSDSIYKFLQENAIKPEYIYAKYVNGLSKIYYKGFKTVTSAKKSLANLQSRGIEGWVLNTPK